MIGYLRSRNTNLQFEVAATIYRLMWREREYKFLPQYLDEKYTQSIFGKDQRGRDVSSGLCVCGRTILKSVLVNM